uniref:Uncharacterized protein n=1 Tax=Solanum lycopersicum TaxID=4081 RepID=A0A3Q7IM73_SOLLC
MVDEEKRKQSQQNVSTRANAILEVVKTMTVSNDYFSFKASRNQLHSCMTIRANAKVFHHTNDSCFISSNKSESNSHFLTMEEQSLFLFFLFNVEKYLSGACNVACPL